jgi:hypothetical protein
MVGSICDYCKFKYCYTHFHYETHGCGQAARDQARKQWLEQQATTTKPLKDWQHNHVRGKLHKKVRLQSDTYHLCHMSLIRAD